MARMEFDCHPIGTRGFVTDGGRRVVEVTVVDVMMVMSLDRGSPRHAVQPLSGPDPMHRHLSFDQYGFGSIHATAEAAKAEMAARAQTTGQS